MHIEEKDMQSRQKIKEKEKLDERKKLIELRIYRLYYCL